MSSNKKIDFSSHITERTRDFTGREWVFERISAWLADPDASRFFLLTGEPGSGKSAIAARLTQFSQAVPELVEGPNGALAPGFLSAFHFCSVRDRRWINPHVFAESLALQLAARYPELTKSNSKKKESTITNNIHVQNMAHSAQVTGTSIGVINNLSIGYVSAEDTFMRVVREPLEVLCRDVPDAQVVILVDALDEALGYTQDVNIVSLLAESHFLAANVRFIVTSRPETEVLRPLRDLKPKELSLTEGIGLTHSGSDVKQYVRDLLSTTSANRLAAELSPEQFANAVQEKSEGNFLYVKQLLRLLTTQTEQINLDTLRQLPDGLDGIYIEFIERLVKNDERAWEERYAPVLGTLAVAQEALDSGQIAGFVGMKTPKVRRLLKTWRQFLDADDSLPASQRTYTIYHSSFADFLLSEDHAEEWWCEATEQHERIATYYLDRYAKYWMKSDRDGHTVTHLAQAAQRNDQPERQRFDTQRSSKGQWPDLPDEHYLWRHLAVHLYAAELRKEWRQLLLSFEWLQAKLNATDINALIADYDFLVQEENDIKRLQHALRQAAHLLAEPEHKSQLAGELWGRLAGDSSPALQRLLSQAARPPETPRLRPLTPSLREHPALLRTLTGHTDTVYGVAVSPDGQLVISASGDKTVKVWDLTSRHPVKTLEGHTDIVYGVAVSPDGQQIISASRDKTLKVWDLANGDFVKTLTGHKFGVYGVAVSPDGQFVISASYRELNVWDLASGDLVKTLEGHNDIVRGVAVSPDGKLIVSASHDKTVKVWDLASGGNLHTLNGHNGHDHFVTGVTVNGPRIISASNDRTLKVWDLANGDLVKTLTGHTDIVRGVTVSPDGQRIISASDDNTLKVWDLTSDDPLNTLTGHISSVTGVAVTPDGQRIISASDDNTLKVWDLTSDRLLNTPTGHTSSVTGVAVTPDGQRIISASYDGTLMVWDLASGRYLHTLDGHTDWVTGVAAIGQRIISASYNGTLKVWDLASGELLKPLIGHTDWVTGVTAIGQRIISASYDGTVKVWDLDNDPAKIVKCLTHHTDGVTGVAAIGQRIILASYDGTLKVWDLDSNDPAKIVESLTHHTDRVTGVAAIEQRIVSASKDETTPETPKARRAGSGRLLKILADWVTKVVWRADMPGRDLAPSNPLTSDTHFAEETPVSRNRQLIISASRDKTLKVWNLARDGRLLILNTLTGHTDIVRGVAVTPNGRLVISASRDKTLRVWELATGKCLTTFHFNESLNACAVAPDGRTVVAGGVLGRVHILRLEGGKRGWS